MVLGQFLSVAGSLVLVRVLTQYLRPEVYGQLALGLSVAGLVNLVVMGGISSGIGRYYPIAAERGDLGGYLKAARSLMRYASIAVAGLGLAIFAGLYQFGHSRWLGLAAATLTFALVTGWNSTLSSIQNAARQRAIVAFHRGLDAWLKILLATGTILWLGASGTAVVIGYSCSAVVITASQLFFLKRTIPAGIDENAQHQRWSRQVWNYSWPFSAWGIFTWMQKVSDRWSLEAFGATEDVGLYAVVFQLGYAPISIFLTMFMAFLAPILYQRAGPGTDESRNAYVHRLTWRITFGALAVTALAFAGTSLLHEQLFGILVGAEYRDVSYLLPWVLLAGGFFGAGQILSLKLTSELKSTTLLAPKIVTAIFGVVLNVIGAAMAGVQGVVAALVIFAFVYLVWIVYLGVGRKTIPMTP